MPNADMSELTSVMSSFGHSVIRHLFASVASVAIFSREGVTNELGTTAGWHAQGRVRSHFRRQAAAVERQRPALCRLGDVSPQGFARRSEPHLCLANQRLVRADHSALRRRRQNLVPAGHAGGRADDDARRHAQGREQQVRLRHVAGHRQAAHHAPVVRRHAAPVGIQTRVASRAVARRIRTSSTPASKMPRIFRSTDGGKYWHELAGLRGHGTGPQWSPGAGGMGLHTILIDPTNPDRMYIAISSAGTFRTDDAGKTWKPINRGLHVAVHSRSGRRGRPLRASHRAAPLAAGRAVHAEALGRDAQRRRRRLSGTKSAATCRPISASRSKSTRTSRRRFTSCRSRAIREHYPPEGKLRVYRSRTRRQRMGAAHEGPAARELLRQRAARRNVDRLARPLRHLLRHDRRPGLRLDRTAATPGNPIVRDLPAVLSVEAQVLP